MTKPASEPIKPYVAASKILPEFTIQALILGVILSLIMCAANIYVGLYAGMTVSAAIPASVISMEMPPWRLLSQMTPGFSS